MVPGFGSGGGDAPFVPDLIDGGDPDLEGHGFADILVHAGSQGAVSDVHGLLPDLRGAGLIGIDMLVKHFPPKVQKALDILFKIMILIFLGILVYYGILMTKTGWKRQITALGISYGWVTMAVPTGAFFMMISTTIKLVERIKTPAGQEIKKEAGRELA